MNLALAYYPKGIENGSKKYTAQKASIALFPKRGERRTSVSMWIVIVNKKIIENKLGFLRFMFFFILLSVINMVDD